MLTKTKAAIVTTLFLSLGAQADTILNVATAGDQNMVDYVKTWLGPKFEAAHPGVKVRVIGTGPGDAGSNKISEKLTAQQESGAQQWDIDVAVVHQKAGGEQVAKGLLQKYRQDIQTGGMVSSPSATQALGVNVDGYVMPMFLSQTAIAWNSDLVTTPPTSYDELVAWTQKHPQAFGYNGIKNGMSGVSFVVGWIYAYGTDAQRLSAGPYDKSVEKGWQQAYEKLKAFNKNVTFTPGNAGTLDMLSRGKSPWARCGSICSIAGKIRASCRRRSSLLYWRRACRASRCITSSRRRRRIRAGARLYRAGHQPGSAGAGDRQAVQLVSGHRRRAGEAEAGCGDLAKAVCRNLAGSAGEVWQKLPDRPLL